MHFPLKIYNPPNLTLHFYLNQELFTTCGLWALQHSSVKCVCVCIWGDFTLFCTITLPRIAKSQVSPELQPYWPPAIFPLTCVKLEGFLRKPSAFSNKLENIGITLGVHGLHPPRKSPGRCKILINHTARLRVSWRTNTLKHTHSFKSTI